MRIVELELQDGSALQALIEECDEFSYLTFNRPPGGADAVSQYLEGTQYCPPAEKVMLKALADDGRLVGAVDALVGYPDGQTASIALLLVRPTSRRQGVGAALVAELAQRASQRGMSRIDVLNVADRNADGIAFLGGVGFERTGRGSVQAYGDVVIGQHVWRRDL